MKIRIKKGIINPAYFPIFKSKKKFKVLKGGGGSGKSVFVSQYLVLKAVNNEYGKRRILVLRKVAKTSKLSTYESFMLMLNAKLLIPAYSAFSQSAGLLTHNKVLAWPPKKGMDDQMNLFRNNVGFIDMFGNISLK